MSEKKIHVMLYGGKPLFGGKEKLCLTDGSFWMCTYKDVFINIDVIKDICNNYSIDTNRIYTTGQSMGGILSFFYETYFNDIFAAYMPVGSQFDNNMVKKLKDRNIIYLVSEGDSKASEGMNELKNLLDEDNTNYSYRYFSIIIYYKLILYIKIYQ